MQQNTHSLSSLFDQLGLDSKTASIEQFIALHKPISSNIELHKATFWNASQASFLKQMKDEDADWSGIIDQLDVMFRKTNIQHSVNYNLKPHLMRN